MLEKGNGRGGARRRIKKGGSRYLSTFKELERLDILLSPSWKAERNKVPRLEEYSEGDRMKILDCWENAFGKQKIVLSGEKALETAKD